MIELSFRTEIFSSLAVSEARRRRDATDLSQVSGRRRQGSGGGDVEVDEKKECGEP